MHTRLVVFAITTQFALFAPLKRNCIQAKKQPKEVFYIPMIHCNPEPDVIVHVHANYTVTVTMTKLRNYDQEIARYLANY